MPAKNPLVIRLGELKEKLELPVSASVPASDFPGAIEEGTLDGKVVVEGVVHNTGETAEFTGTAKGKWTLECVRCLKPVPGEFRGAFTLSAPIDAESMDLTEEVRQTIALERPMKSYCRPDCKGLCPVCRKNRNDGDCGHAEPALPSPGRTRLTQRRNKS